MDEEKMDQFMKILEAGLGNILKDVGDVKCIKGSKDKIIDTFMKYPILEVSGSRAGTNIQVSQCSVQDIIDILPDVIGHLLSLVPKDTRNGILYNAITKTKMTDNGSLKDEADEQCDEEYEDEDDE